MQDSQDPNPLIRALAVRTMGCIRVDKITEYLCDPLQRTLKVGLSKLELTSHLCQHLTIRLPYASSTRCFVQDDDPYVRKTAAMCVAKLHDINAELVEDRGFLDILKVLCPGGLSDLGLKL